MNIKVIAITILAIVAILYGMFLLSASAQDITVGNSDNPLYLEEGQCYDFYGLHERFEQHGFKMILLTYENQAVWGKFDHVYQTQLHGKFAMYQPYYLVNAEDVMAATPICVHFIGEAVSVPYDAEAGGWGVEQ